MTVEGLPYNLMCWGAFGWACTGMPKHGWSAVIAVPIGCAAVAGSMGGDVYNMSAAAATGFVVPLFAACGAAFHMVGRPIRRRVGQRPRVIVIVEKANGS